MTETNIQRAFRCALATSIIAVCTAAGAVTSTDELANGVSVLATGQITTPLAVQGASQQFLNPGLAKYPNFIAGEAVDSQMSPDRKTLAVVTAGHNSQVSPLPNPSVDVGASTQYVFLYDVSGANRATPKLKQVIQQTNAATGLAFSPNGQTLYVPGGADDVVYVYGLVGGAWTLNATVALNHANKGIGLGVRPNAAGLALSPDGSTLAVVNNYNDSVTIIDTATATVRYEHDLRPFAANNEKTDGAAGGTYPFAAAFAGNGILYVSSDRDREVIALSVPNAQAAGLSTPGSLIARIPLAGNALGMTLSGSNLFVAQDNADAVAVIDTNTNKVVRQIDTRGPEELASKLGRQTGAATFNVSVSPDGTLYAINAGSNSIAVIPTRGERAYKVTGLIPTAYEPHDVAFSADGSYMYIINGKSVTGPNPGWLYGNTARLTSVTYPGGNALAAAGAFASNQYQFQLERASLVAAPVPSRSALATLTAQVASNNHYDRALSASQKKVVDFLSERIKHVIYIVKENRTFDQILGDLNNGSNGDSTLTVFGRSITPSLHSLASQFVTLDNFRDPGDGSMDGWAWAMQGRTTNTNTLNQQANYAFVSRGLSYDSEGTNRNLPVNFGTVAGRDGAAGLAGTTNYTAVTSAMSGGPANVLAGTGNHASSDAPFGKQQGYIFDAVLNAGKSVRNYGFLVNNVGTIGTAVAPVSSPYAQGAIQVAPLDPGLAAYTDVYFRGYDQKYPDLWRFDEWKREFDGYVASGNLPSLSMVRLSHDHTGSFASALAGVNTPETQEADNDLSTGRLVEAVANSRYAKDTLIIVTEDDCQDAPDHVDSHRSTAYVVGPYVKKGAVVSTRYSQVNALRTIEDILGTAHLNLYTANETPMTDVFDIRSDGKWNFVATASTVLSTTTLAMERGGSSLRFADGDVVRPTHDVAYWAAATQGMDFSDADQVNPELYNRILWKGLKDDAKYPVTAGAGDSEE